MKVKTNNLKKSLKTSTVKNGVSKVKKKVISKKKKPEPKVVEEGSSDEDFSDVPSETSDIDEDEGGVEDIQEHKKSLSKLQEVDPDFYKYLEENDKKLLQFDLSDSEEDDDVDDEPLDKIHKPSTDFEVDSEESDFEDDKKKRKSNVVTLALVQTWKENLINSKSLESISQATRAFEAALAQVTSEEDVPGLKVEGGAVFNAIIEMCVLHLQPAIVDFLKLPSGTIRNPEKNKKWTKIRNILHSYLTGLLKLMSAVAAEHIVIVLLKHFHMMCPFLSPFVKLRKVALKHLTRHWSTGEETSSVLAYLCILRITTLQKGSLLATTLRLLYISYVRSCKFVSPNSLPQINFMKRSLADLFALDPNVSYEHAFLYIRQLAIHLRNAVTTKKKENFQSVYNWQYIQSIRLWVELFSSPKVASSPLQQLLYPLVQIIIGCIKLIPTGQYIPLRFHCIQMLIKLNRDTDTYIPVLPFVIDALTLVDLNKSAKNLSMKPFDFTCVLRLSKAAMNETAFHDAIIENVYESLIETAYNSSYTVCFPDEFLPATVQLKNFVKNCKQAKYVSKIKQILSKIEENSKYISDERNKLTINLSDTTQLKAFEMKIREKGTPVSKFWDSWHKVHNITKAKRSTGNVKLGDMGLPMMIKPIKKPKKEDDGPVELFPSDDENDSDPGFPELEEDVNGKTRKVPKKPADKKAKAKRTKKSVQKMVEPKSEDDSEEDIHEAQFQDEVKDFNIDEF